jgi:protease YdgD
MLSTGARRNPHVHHDHVEDRDWISSSAIANSVSGMVRPRALAVLRLMDRGLFLHRCELPQPRPWHRGDLGSLVVAGTSPATTGRDVRLVQYVRNCCSIRSVLQSTMLPLVNRASGSKTMTLNRVFRCMAFGSMNFLHIATTLAQPAFNEGRSPLWQTPNVPTPATPGSSEPKALVNPINRLPMPPKEWPWSAIGRVNVTNQGFCTGTLVAPRIVITAAHCLVVARTNSWVKPDDVHFVAGLIPPAGYMGHSIAESFVASPDFKCTLEDCPLSYSAGVPSRGIPLHMIKTDWAIIKLKNELSVRPIPIEAIHDADFSRTGDAQIVLPGFGADRPFLLAAHKGCSVKIDAPELGSGSLTHRCETFLGGSGSPVLLMRNGRVSLIGIATAVPRLANTPNASGRTAGFGVSAVEFAAATGTMVPPTGQ